MPLSIIDYNPRFRVGIEYYTHQKIGFSFDMGYGNKSLYDLIDHFGDIKWGESYELTEYRAQLNYFMILKKQIAFYIGPELFFIQTHDVLNNGYFVKPYYPNSQTKLYTHYDQANFYRQKVGVHLKIGLKLIALKRVAFDFFVGLGIAHRKIEYSHIINPKNLPLYPLRELFLGSREKAGEKYIPHLAYGVKIGIILWEKDKKTSPLD